jgi:KaiC/GvpD/RAD55 family RecA-like ATPase
MSTIQIEQQRKNTHRLDLFKEFFRWKPTSLLIRGEPGAGKSTLALELLDYVKDSYKGYYISTRVSHKRLLEQFPWCKDLIKEEEVLSMFGNNGNGSAPLIDARLGTISTVTEHVMNAIMEKNAFIILDSWDALAKEADMNDRLKAEKTMVALADANDSFLVFISEEPHLSTVAYLVDGVITLEHYNNLRSMRLDKMRGMSINDKRIFYTLENSHFTPISKLSSILYKIDNKSIFEPIIYNNKLSSGNKDLDKVISVYKSNAILIETALNRDRRMLGVIMLNFILNNLRTGGSAIIINTPDKPYSSLLNQIKPYCKEEDLERLLILSVEENLPALNYLESISYSDLKGSCNKLVCNRYPELKKKTKDKPTILTLDLGMCETQLTSDALDIVKSNIVKLTKIFRDNGDYIIFVDTTGYKSMLFLLNIVDLHLRLYTEEGVSFLQAIKPYNGTYGVELDVSKGYPSYKLRRMV